MRRIPVEHRTDDEPTRVVAQLRPTVGVEGIDGADQADRSVADEIVEIEARHEPFKPPRKPLHDRQQASYLIVAIAGAHRVAPSGKRQGRKSRAVAPRYRLRHELDLVVAEHPVTRNQRAKHWGEQDGHP